MEGERHWGSSAPSVRDTELRGPLTRRRAPGPDVSRGRRACRRDSKKLNMSRKSSKVGILNLKVFGFGSRGDEGDAVAPVRKSTCIVGSDGQISGRPQQEEKGENGGFEGHIVLNSKTTEPVVLSVGLPNVLNRDTFVYCRVQYCKGEPSYQLYSMYCTVLLLP